MVSATAINFGKKYSLLNIAAFITKKISLNKEHRFSRFMVRLSFTATMISVGVMLMTIFFTQGFEKTISNKVFSFFGHVRIQDYNTVTASVTEEIPIYKKDSVYQLKNQYKEIRHIQSYATKNALLKTSQTFEGVLFKGVDRDYDFQHLSDFLVAGRWIHFRDSGYSQEINLSETMARQLQLKVNDPLLVFFIQPDGSAPRPRKLTVVGIYKTGIEEYDKMLAIGDLSLIQRLNNWSPTEIGGYEIFLHDAKDMEMISRTIVPALPLGLNSLTIKEVIPTIFDWLELQHKTIYIVMIIMIIIAILNLVTCLLILVLERVRMIGLLKALGASNGLVRRIFIYQGAFITGVGILCGNLLGVGIGWLQQKFGFITLPEESYYISKAAVYIDPWQIVWVDLLTFTICLLVLLLPSLVVQRIQPVKTIQFR